jgi:hypothetical protein
MRTRRVGRPRMERSRGAIALALLLLVGAGIAPHSGHEWFADGPAQSVSDGGSFLLDSSGGASVTADPASSRPHRHDCAACLHKLSRVIPAAPGPWLEPSAAAGEPRVASSSPVPFRISHGAPAGRAPPTSS